MLNDLQESDSDENMSEMWKSSWVYFPYFRNL
jgi:hypothetical protein